MANVTDEIDPAAARWAPHLRTGAFAALLPLALGFPVLIGWIWLGGFGIVLGVFAAIGLLMAWRRRQDAVFPSEIEPGALLTVLVVTVVLGGIAFISNAA
jgi:hypothetical protein